MRRELMKLYMSEFKADEVLGIYGGNKDRLASRMRFLHPDAARSFRKMDNEIKIKVSDMRRTARGSLSARKRRGRGLRPGWSGHNYGFSIDIEYDWLIARSSAFRGKRDLDLWMAGHGWYCHNIIGETRDYEAWHYNYFGDEAEHYLSFRTERKNTWSRCVSQKINEYYGHWWLRADVATVQVALKKLNMYGGTVDNKTGTRTRSGVKLFQKAWGLPIDGIAGPMTKRTLMLVSAETVLANEVC